MTPTYKGRLRRGEERGDIRGRDHPRGRRVDGQNYEQRGLTEENGNGIDAGVGIR